MGKTRRTRSKYHISSVHGDFGPLTSESSNRNQPENEAVISQNLQDYNDSKQDDSMDIKESELTSSRLKDESSDWKIVPDDDLFKNIDINVDELETSIQKESDARPTGISISKCIKRSIAETGAKVQLKKEDKRELRRNLFIKKIDAIHQKIFKKKQKKPKAINFCTEEDGTKSKRENLSDSLSQNVKNLEQVPKPAKMLSTKVSKKKQSTKGKLKSKTKEMLSNIEFLNQIMLDNKYKSDAMGVITDAVQKHVYSDL